MTRRAKRPASARSKLLVGILAIAAIQPWRPAALHGLQARAETETGAAVARWAEIAAGAAAEGWQT